MRKERLTMKTMNFKKIATMGLATMMAVSAMSVSAFAEEAIYNSDGEIIGYEFTEDDVENKNYGIDLIAQIPSFASFSASAPSYSSSPKDLTDGDYVEPFSLSAGGAKYSKTWTGSASKCGMRFYNASDMSKLTMYIYRITSSGKVEYQTSHTFSKTSIGYTSVSLDSDEQYYMMLVNSATSSQSGSVVFTNSPSSYGLGS